MHISSAVDSIAFILAILWLAHLVAVAIVEK